MTPEINRRLTLRVQSLLLVCRAIAIYLDFFWVPNEQLSTDSGAYFRPSHAPNESRPRCSRCVFLTMSEADEIARQLRVHLGASPPEFLPPEVTRPFLARLTSSTDCASTIARVEELLQDIYHTDVDHSTPDHACIVVAFLHQIRKQLPAASIISTWFDLLLRPAMREPRIRKDTIDQVQDLVVGALKDSKASNSKQEEFAKRLLELYLLDAPNLSSGEEALEKVSLDRDERRRRKFWKNNLESTLLAFAVKNPAVSFSLGSRSQPSNFSTAVLHSSRHCIYRAHVTPPTAAPIQSSRSATRFTCD